MSTMAELLSANERLYKENEKLREKLKITVENLKGIIECGKLAHKSGEPTAHAYQLGMATGKAQLTLDKIK